MYPLRRLTRNPALLLFLAMLLVLALALIAFGAALQGPASTQVFGMPTLWFGGLIVLPLVLYFLLVIVWKRFDRIAR